MIAEGAAFLDRSGRLLAADECFRLRMGLPDTDAADALRRRAENDPALKALIAGEGPDRVCLAVAGPDEVELTRTPSAGGLLLTARPANGAAAPPAALEHAMRSIAMTRIAAGLAHDVKNPLNAMALQVALLSDKLAGAGEPIASSTAAHVQAIRDQIGRVNELVRRFLDVADPTAPLGYTDVAALAADVARVHAHDARRQRIELAIEPAKRPVCSSCDPARLGRLLVALVSRALAETPAGGRLAVSTAVDGGAAVMHIEHTSGPEIPDQAYVLDVAVASAEAMGGRLHARREGGVEAIELRLPRDDRP